MTKIMLVEDDNNLREIYEARLSAEGYEIVAAPNGEAALALASKEHPDMIISDVMMPKISGFEMLDILRNTESLRNVKIIMLTALGQAEDSQRANSLGADRYLVKSQVTLEDIVRTAHELLNDVDSSTLPAEASADTAAPESPAEPTPEATAPAVEPAPAPAPEPATDTVPVAPEPVAPEPAPAESMPVSEPTEPAEPVEAPAVAEAPAEPVTPAPDPVVPAPPAVSDNPAPDAQAAEPPAEPVPAPSVISIPITDGPAEGTDPAATQDNNQTDSSLPVVEPPSDAPADDTEVPAPNVIAIPDSPADEVTDTPAESSAPADNTPAPDMPQPATEPSQEVLDAAPQDVASEEASMKAQIDSFINTPEVPTPTEAPAESVAPEPEAIASAAEPAPEAVTPAPEPTPETAVSSVPEAEPAPAPVSVEIPAIVPASTDMPVTEMPAVQPSSDNTEVVEPTPESLDNYAGPVISAPSASTSTSIPVTEVTDTEPAPAEATEAAVEAYDAQLVADAAENLAAGTAQPGDTVQPGAADAGAPTPTSVNRMKVVAPLPSSADKPNIHQLLELEEAKNAAQQAAQSTAPQRPNVDAYKPSTPNPGVPADTPKPSIDPNSISL